MRSNKIFTILLLSFIILFSILACGAAIPKQKVDSTTYWWIGVTSQGHFMPVSNEEYEANLIGDTYGNQAQPLLLSNKGGVIWSQEPFKFKMDNGKFVRLEAKGEIETSRVGNSLKEAYLYASAKYFPPQNKMPDELLITAPQYNTWIELIYNQNQADILKYAHAIIENGFPAGVLMIDDNWQEDYGKWNFHPGRFPDPKKMMNELHALGFKVMLWVCPFVSPDCDVYRDLASKGAFLVNDNKQSVISTLPTVDFRGNRKPEMVTWWNGISAVLDLSNPVAADWFNSRLTMLQKEFGVDGFKFDAGDAGFYAQGISKGGVSANTQAELFGQVGLAFPLNEYRAMWKMGGQPLVQRLRDKAHSWGDLSKLVPSMELQGLMGYYFNCPDMIGGGEFTSFLDGAVIDQELIVRSAQCHALMPMMQFSVAPWRILSKENLQAVQQVVKLRQRFSSYILENVRKSAKSGIPAMRPMAFDYPEYGAEKYNQQFMMGEALLVAPVIAKGATFITVFLPSGKWKGFNGQLYKGGKEITVPVTLFDLPFFINKGKDV